MMLGRVASGAMVRQPRRVVAEIARRRKVASAPSVEVFAGRQVVSALHGMTAGKVDRESAGGRRGVERSMSSRQAPTVVPGLSRDERDSADARTMSNPHGDGSRLSYRHQVDYPRHHQRQDRRNENNRDSRRRDTFDSNDAYDDVSRSIQGRRHKNSASDGRRGQTGRGGSGGGGVQSKAKTKEGGSSFLLNISKTYVAKMLDMQKARTWKKVIDAYKEQSVEPGFSLRMFNATIGALSRSPGWQVAISIFGDIEKAGFQPDIYSYNATIHACVEGGHRDLAFSLFDQMAVEGIMPDVFTYNYMIAICGKSKEWERALSIIQEMEDRSIRACSMTYNAAIVACGNGLQPDRAVALLQEMRQKGVQLTEGTFSATIAACGKAGQWERALAVLDLMKEGEDNLEPNEYCYSSAICACEKSLRWEEALALLREMQAADLVVSSWPYVHVIKACSISGEVAQAEALLDEMQASGLFVKEGIRTMVARLKRKRRHQTWRDKAPDAGTAALTSRQAEKRAAFAGPPRAAPDRRETESLSAAAVSSPGEQEATVVNGDAIASSEESPKSPAWSESVTTRATSGGGNPTPDTDRAPRHEGAARKKVVRLHAKSLLRNVGQHERFGRWSDIVLDLETAVADPGIKVSMRMYAGCITALANGGRWAEAMRVLEMLLGNGLEPDTRCVTAAIRACARSDPPRWGMALSLFQGLSEPDEGAYVATLSALAKAGQWKTSVKLLDGMQPAGVKPNLFCYNLTMEAFSAAKPPQWQSACEMLARIEEDGMRPNMKTYSVAIHACLGAFEAHAAQEVMGTMVQAGFMPSDELRMRVDEAVSSANRNFR